MSEARISTAEQLSKHAFVGLLRAGNWLTEAGLLSKAYGLRGATVRADHGSEGAIVLNFIRRDGGEVTSRIEPEDTLRYGSDNGSLLHVWRPMDREFQRPKLEGGGFYTKSEPTVILSFRNEQRKLAARAERKALRRIQSERWQDRRPKCDDLIITRCPTRGEILIAVKHLIDGEDPPKLRFTTKDGKEHEHVLAGVREGFSPGFIRLSLRGTEGASINPDTQSGSFNEE